MESPPKRRIGWLLFTLGLLGVTVAGLWQRYTIYDQVRLWHYQPPAAVMQLADETTMTGGTRRVFYANHPLVEDKVEFAGHCVNKDEKTNVLGCFIHNKGIYIYNVSDSRLHGIQEVTAAHEVLHAEYERLDPIEKKKVDAMTAAAYAKVTDKRIRDNIQAYQDNHADIPNELHSILGTEVANLPADLESYYKRYFSNRQALVAFNEYQDELTSRRQQVVAMDAQLKTMKQQLDQTVAKLEQEIKQINTSYDQLQSLKRSGQIQAYNAAVPVYNQSVTSYNNELKDYRSAVNKYNELVVQRNNINLEEQELVQAQDSRLDAVQSQ